MLDKEKKTIADLLPKSPEEADNTALLAKLTGEDGKLRVDLSMPDGYHDDIMATQMIENLTAYEQNRQAWRAARNQGNNGRSTQLFEQMNYHQLVVAIIQAEYPNAKIIADAMMEVRARGAKINRENALKGE